MPNLLKKTAPTKIGKNAEKKTFVGLPNQQPNGLDNYLIKPPAGPTMFANVIRPGNHTATGNNGQRERLQFGRPPVEEIYNRPGLLESNVAVKKPGAPTFGVPQPVKSRPEGERMGGAKLRFQEFGGYMSVAGPTTSESNSTDSSYRVRLNSSDSSAESTPKLDIVGYYKARGMDYFEERKKCRQYITRRPSEFSPLTDHERLTGGAIYWDEYTPPPGFTWKDLEGIPIPEDPLPESPKGNQISPCVLKAANIRFKQQTPASLPSSQNFREIIEQLESMQTERQKFIDERRKRKEEKRKQKQAKAPKDDSNRSMYMEVSANAIENETGSFPVADCNGNDFDFPNDEDSFVQRATQLEERVVVKANQDHGKPGLNVQKDNSRILSPRNRLNREIGGNTPVTSGSRMVNGNKMKRRSTLKRPSGRLDFSNEISGSPVKKSSTTTSPDSGESFSFEKSTVENKMESPKVPIPTPKRVVGDFFEDDDDDVFSQIPMPGLPQEGQNSRKNASVNEKSTELISGNSSSVSAFDGESIDEDFLIAALEQVEATAKQSKVYTSTPMQHPNRVALETPESTRAALRKSVRINTNNLSAIKIDPSKTNVLNESKEKPQSKSRLSRSFVRSRK